jgi:hypothetical protein
MPAASDRWKCLPCLLLPLPKARSKQTMPGWNIAEYWIDSSSLIPELNWRNLMDLSREFLNTKAHWLDWLIFCPDYKARLPVKPRVVRAAPIDNTDRRLVL